MNEGPEVRAAGGASDVPIDNTSAACGLTAALVSVCFSVAMLDRRVLLSTAETAITVSTAPLWRRSWPLSVTLLVTPSASAPILNLLLMAGWQAARAG